MEPYRIMYKMTCKPVCIFFSFISQLVSQDAFGTVYNIHLSFPYFALQEHFDSNVTLNDKNGGARDCL